MDNKTTSSRNIHTTKYTLITFTACFFIIILANSVEANPVLGVNYYGESLMGTNGINYIPRNISEVAYDMDHIHQISNHIKMYMNPFVSQNLLWNEQILQLTKERGMYTVVNMMVDDRCLEDSTWNDTLAQANDDINTRCGHRFSYWDDYSTHVINACAALSGKTDEILVGNEIILRSHMSDADIKNKVVALINDCQKVFPGPVSYEEFWWAHDAWQNYTGKIYLMQYEDLPVFEKNAGIMDQMFGSNAIVGEWGEDLLDGTTDRDENWQAAQVALRYNILSKTRTPVAYIFTYEEQSWNAFGIVRPDGVERPVWTYLKGLGYGDGTGTIIPPIITPPANNQSNGTTPPIIIPPQSSNTTVYVTKSFMADLNTVFVCNAKGFTPTTYSWDFGDGSIVSNRGVNDVYHSFPSNGTFTITCTANSGTMNATGGISININGRGIGPALIQQMTPLSNNNYNVYCDAIGYKPGYCQKITSTNGFSYDWNCTAGSPGFDNLNISLAHDGDYILQCVMHLSDSSQLQNYYTEGSTYHVNTCNTPNGCILVQQNISFVVGNGTPITSGTNNTINDTANNTVNNTNINTTAPDPIIPASTPSHRSSSHSSGSYIQQSTVVINNTQPTIINSTNNTSTTLTSINTSSNTSIITIPPDQTNSITGLAASPLLTPSSIIIAPATATDAQITTTNDLSLMWWIIGGVILLLVIALIIVSIINSANQNSARKKNIPSAHHNLFGNIHPLTDIEGISQKYTRGLQTMGIKNTTQLREANATKVAHGTGASLGAVKSWQHMAELSSVKDIGPQYAELLEQSGIHSIDQLSSYNPDELLKLMNEKQDSLKISLQGNSADYATVEHWINEARDHQVMESEGEIA